jgi:riboflavin transporter FmnP
MMTLLAMFCALSFIAVAAIRIPLVPAVPFLKYEPKDAIIMTGGFLFGPMAAALISFIVSFIEMVSISETGFIGLIMNIISTASFVCPAAYIYKKRRSMAGALAGMAVGLVLMTLVMALWNYLITPLYMGYPREAVAKLILPAFIPYNLLKGAINAGLTLLVYKPVVGVLRKSNLVALEENDSPKRKFSLGMTLVAAALLITSILVVLVLQRAI